MDRFSEEIRWRFNYSESFYILVRLTDELISRYRKNVTELLTQQKFKKAGQHTMLIKTNAVIAKNRELAYMEA